MALNLKILISNSQELEIIKSIMAETQLYGKFIEAATDVILRTSEKKQKLIVIILEDSNAKTKLQKIRRTLLEFHQQTNQQIKENEKDNKEVITSLTEVMPDLSIDQIKFTTDMMKRVYDPLLIQKKLLDSIGNVMRSEDMTDEQKIEKISDLLL